MSFQWQKIKSGEHAGFWCVSYHGMGLYGRTKSEAVKALLAVIERAKRTRISDKTFIVCSQLLR